MAEKRRGLGRGLGALIPSGNDRDTRPVDVFFPGRPEDGAAPSDGATTLTQDAPPVPAPPSDGVAGESNAATSSLSTASVAAAPESVSAVSDGVEVPAPDSVPSAGSDQAATGGSADGGADLVPVPGARFAEIPLDEIRPNPRQPRTVFDEEALVELVASVREIGVLQPVVVRPLVPAEDGAKYELIMGERRWRASQQAELGTIPAIIRETSDDDLLRDALLENLHRSNLNPLEEAAAYQQLLDDFACTHDELAQRIHRSRPQITNTLRLLRLPPTVQRRVAAGVLSAGHARALLGLPDSAAMERLAQRIVAEGLSVRATEEIVALGGDAAPSKAAPRAPRPGERNEALDELAARLSDRFDTRVKVALGKSKGRLTVEFASVQDLNRILDVIAPDDPGLLR